MDVDHCSIELWTLRTYAKLLINAPGRTGRLGSAQLCNTPTVRLFMMVLREEHLIHDKHEPRIKMLTQCAVPMDRDAAQLRMLVHPLRLCARPTAVYQDVHKIVSPARGVHVHRP